MGVWCQLAANCQLHVDAAAIFVAHTLCQTWILIVKVLVAMQRHIAQPSDLLGAHAAEDLEVLITHMHGNPQWLHLLELAARKLAQRVCYFCHFASLFFLLTIKFLFVP